MEGTGATLTWMAVIMAGISLIDTVVGRFLNYFEKRDAKQFDKDMTMLKAELATTRTELETTKLLQMRSTIDSEAAKKAVEECKEAHASIEAEFKAYRAAHETNAARIDKLEAANGSDKPAKG